MYIYTLSLYIYAIYIERERVRKEEKKSTFLHLYASYNKFILSFAQNSYK